MGNFFDDLEKFTSIASAPIKADIDGLSNQIESLENNLLSATTQDQINTANKNIDNFYNKAKRYKITKIQADNLNNKRQNKNLAFTDYKTAITQADEYLSTDEFLNKADEWQNLDKLAKSKEYTNVIDFVVDEQDKIQSWLNKLTQINSKGERVLSQFNYTDTLEYGSDDDIVSQLFKYQSRLNTAMESLIGDETITMEEAQLILMSTDAEKVTRARAIKDRNVNEAVDSIKTHTRFIKSFEEDLLKQIDTDMGGFQQFMLNPENKGMADKIDFQITDTASELKEKITNLIIEQGDALTKAQKKYKNWTGMNWDGSQTAIDDDDAESLFDAAKIEGENIEVDENAEEDDSDDAGADDKTDDDTKTLSSQFNVENVDIDEIIQSVSNPEYQKLANKQLKKLTKELNDIKLSIDNYSYKKSGRIATENESLYDIKYGKGNWNKKSTPNLNYNDLQELKAEFEKDAANYTKALQRLEDMKSTNLPMTEGPFYATKFTDFGNEVRKIKQEIENFKMKWKTQSPDLDSEIGDVTGGKGLPFSKTKHGSKGPAAALIKALRDIETKVSKHKEKKLKLDELIANLNKK